jgi:SAM-dependent methyltransferase
LSPFLQRVRLKAARPHLLGRVFDYGCGNGALAAFVPQDSYYGYDRAADVVATARHAFPNHTFSTALPRGMHFDTVVALAVIEHFNKPAEEVSRWKEYLRDGGHIVLTTPHKSFGWTHLLGAAIGIFSREAEEEHETMFNGASLKALAKNTCLECIDYRRFLFGANQLCIMKK